MLVRRKQKDRTIRFGREARALVAAKVEELDQLDDEALGKLIEEPFEEVTAGPSRETYDVVTTGYAGKGIPEDEPDIYVLVEATRTGDRPPYIEIEGEIARFRDPEAKRYNWTRTTGEDASEGFGLGDLVVGAVIVLPWVAGIVFVVTRFV